jgi:hypothetical protein
MNMSKRPTTDPIPSIHSYTNLIMEDTSLPSLTPRELERIKVEQSVVRLKGGQYAYTRPGPVSPRRSQPRLADLRQVSRARHAEKATNTGWFSVCLLCCTYSLTFARVQNPPSSATLLPPRPVRFDRRVDTGGEIHMRLRVRVGPGELWILPKTLEVRVVLLSLISS